MQALRLEKYAHLFKGPDQMRQFAEILADLKEPTKIVLGPGEDDYFILVPHALTVARVAMKGRFRSEVADAGINIHIPEREYEESAAEIAVQALLDAA